MNNENVVSFMIFLYVYMRVCFLQIFFKGEILWSSDGTVLQFYLFDQDMIIM